MTDPNNQDLLDAIASQLAIARDGFPHGIPLGPGTEPCIERIDYQEGDHQVWLRLTNGDAWLLRVHQLGSRVMGESEVGYNDVLRSYISYRSLMRQWAKIEKTIKTAGMEDIDPYLQAWHDDVLSDDERSDYDRWVSGGYASSEEARHIQRLRDNGTLTD